VTWDWRIVFGGFALAIPLPGADASNAFTIALLLVMLPDASITHVHASEYHTC